MSYRNAMRALGACPSCLRSSNPNDDPHVIKCCHFNDWLVWIWEFSEVWELEESRAPAKSWCVHGPVPDDPKVREEDDMWYDDEHTNHYQTDFGQVMQLYDAKADPDHILGLGPAPTALTTTPA